MFGFVIGCRLMSGLGEKGVGQQGGINAAFNDIVIITSINCG